MTKLSKADFENKSLNELVGIVTENVDGIESYEYLKDFAKSMVDEDALSLATHVLDAIFENTEEYYVYDCSMGTLKSQHLLKINPILWTILKKLATSTKTNYRKGDVP